MPSDGTGSVRRCCAATFRALAGINDEKMPGRCDVDLREGMEYDKQHPPEAEEDNETIRGGERKANFGAG